MAASMRYPFLVRQPDTGEVVHLPEGSDVPEWATDLVPETHVAGAAEAPKAAPKK